MPPHIRFERYRDMLEASGTFAPWLLDAVDGLDEALIGLREPIWFVKQFAVGDDNPPEWLGVLTNQLVNELLDLTELAVEGRGRPAVKCARSLFDLCLTAKDLAGDPAMQKRYEDHAPVVRHRHLTNQLDGREPLSSAERHRYSVLERENRGPAEHALATYGRGFRSGWHPRTLADRAIAHEMADAYEWYRLASAVMHGSAIGVAGQRAQFRGGPTLHRTGPAIGHVGPALEMGLQFSREAFEALSDDLGRAVEMITDAIERVEALVPEIDRVVSEEDSSLWHGLMPMNLGAFVCVTKLHAPRWHLRLGMTTWVRPMLSAPDAPQQASIDDLVSQLQSEMSDNEVRTIGVLLPTRRLLPTPNSSWRDRPGWFVQPPLGEW